MDSIQRQLLLFRAFAEHTRAIVAAKDLDGRHIYVNSEYCRLLGKAEHECLGRCDGELMPAHAARQARSSDSYVIRHQEAVHVEESIVLDGMLRHYQAVRFPIHDHHGELCATGFVATEITDCKRLAEELRIRAERDPLTGCYNRAKLLEIAEFEVHRAARYHYPLTVLMLDIDHFKIINDSHGHAAGDCVLKGIAELCSQSMRENDTLGRLGGDEFVILLPHTDIQEGMELARRIRHALGEWVLLEDDGRSIPVTASIGLAQRSNVFTSFDQMLAAADAAMYQAKHDGRNCIRPNMQDRESAALRSLFCIAPQ